MYLSSSEEMECRNEEKEGNSNGKKLEKGREG